MTAALVLRRNPRMRLCGSASAIQVGAPIVVDLAVVSSSALEPALHPRGVEVGEDLVVRARLLSAAALHGVLLEAPPMRVAGYRSVPRAGHLVVVIHVNHLEGRRGG